MRLLNIFVMMNNVIKIVLLVIILVLAYLIYDSIMRPVRFNKEVDKRNKAIVQKLIDIRSAEITFKAIHGKYVSDFDSLIDFLKTGEIPVVKMIPDPEDTTFTKTIRDTIGNIPVLDSLFGKRTDFNVAEFKYIPFTDKQVFSLDAGTIEKGGVKVHVFESSALYNLFLKGLDKQMVINLIASKEQMERFPGLKVGSMDEASTDGNWE